MRLSEKCREWRGYLYDETSDAGAAVAAGHKADSDECTWSGGRWRQEPGLGKHLELSRRAIRHKVRVVWYLTPVNVHHHQCETHPSVL